MTHPHACGVIRSCNHEQQRNEMHARLYVRNDGSCDCRFVAAEDVGSDVSVVILGLGQTWSRQVQDQWQACDVISSSCQHISKTQCMYVLDSEVVVVHANTLSAEPHYYYVLPEDSNR